MLRNVLISCVIISAALGCGSKNKDVPVGTVSSSGEAIARAASQSEDGLAIYGGWYAGTQQYENGKTMDFVTFEKGKTTFRTECHFKDAGVTAVEVVVATTFLADSVIIEEKLSRKKEVTVGNMITTCESGNPVGRFNWSVEKSDGKDLLTFGGVTMTRN